MRRPSFVRRAPDGGQDVAALDALRAGGRAHGERHILSGSAIHAKCLGRHETFDPFVAEDPLHLLRDVGILLAEQV